MSEDDIYTALMGIQSELGRLSAECRGVNAAIVQHIEDDKTLANRISGLELTRAGQRGSMKTVVAIGTVVGALATLIFTSLSDWLVAHWH